MQSRGACLLVSYLASSAACGGSSSDSDPANHGGSSRSDEPIDYGFVTVTANGSAMNRACSAGCEWELAADATGSFTVSDSAGTESFELDPSESEALLAAVGDEHFVQALQDRKACVDVTDGSRWRISVMHESGNWPAPNEGALLRSQSQGQFGDLRIAQPTTRRENRSMVTASKPSPRSSRCT
jgi:hypothetical protein